MHGNDDTLLELRFDLYRGLLASLLFLVLPSDGLDSVADDILELLPWRPVQPVAQFSEIVHLPPAISAPFASCHINDEIAVMFRIVYSWVLSIFTASAHWEAIDLSLWDESSMRSDPGLIGVQMLHCILLFVFPFHMLLFVAHGIPPDV